MVATGIPAVQAFVFDEGQARNFLFQTALARTLAEAVRTAWDSMDQLQIEDFFGALRADLTPGGSPMSGFAAIRSGAGDVRRRARQLYPASWREFTRHALGGAGPMKGFLDAQDELGKEALFGLRSISLQAMKVSALVDEILKELLVKLEQIRSAADVALEGMWIDSGAGAPSLILCPSSGPPLAVSASADWAKAGDAQVLLGEAATREWPDLPTATGTEETPGFIIHAHICVPDTSAARKAESSGPKMPKMPGKAKDLLTEHAADKALKGCGMRTGGKVLRGATCWHLGQEAQRAASRLQDWLDR